MYLNNWKILAVYDKLPILLSQLNISRGRNLSDSPQRCTFLQLYGGCKKWYDILKSTFNDYHPPHVCHLKYLLLT